MAYSELIKNFDNIRSYMKEFYVYGFKTRDEYGQKSARSYDNERRRIQSYMGDLVSFRQTPSGKIMFISLDGRSVTHNPLYRAFKAKSFTDKDITLHFIMLDILAGGGSYTNQELLWKIDEEYLSFFANPISFDESTLRKKLKEYEKLGIVLSEKEGRVVKYRIVKECVEPGKFAEAIRFFTEENLLGVIGSYLEDRWKADNESEIFSFKNHYIMSACDAEVIYSLLQAIHEKRQIEIANFGRRAEKYWHVIPLKLYVSTQGGRNYLICKSATHGHILSFRIDYIRNVKLEQKVTGYEEMLAEFEVKAGYMWGVTCNDGERTEHIEMDIYVGPEEDFIVRRLYRERRCGTVTKIDEETYRYEADVYNAYEMVPWIRSFFGRIKKLECENESVVQQLQIDLKQMAKQYGVIE